MGSDRIASFLANFVFPDATEKVVVDLSYTLQVCDSEGGGLGWAHLGSVATRYSNELE